MVQLADAMLPTRSAKLIVLDRDGVINYDSEHFIKSPEEWRPVPGSLEAIGRLNHAGYRVVVATNQSGIGRGLFDMGMLNTIHEKMRTKDELTTRNYLRVTMINIHDELTKRIDASAVAADLVARG